MFKVMEINPYSANVEKMVSS